ncbi:MAG: tRNA pseudouridine(38-40) synthase TruA [Helicobacteraceae bacterium]|jgi:tRNA pseudouridine38-40 synthase|nr:tRNA pseudouridine(38-40) synthase TruA [Helicobacteraceae bacterium]
MKAKVTIAYDGSLFFGSQYLRKNGDLALPTVLSVFEEALRSIGVFSAIAHAGRTDRYVHALGQVLGFSIPDFWSNADRLKTELNKKLYPKILVRKVEIVSDDFHPRFSAKSRVYRYVISTTRPSIILSRFVTYSPDFDYRRAKMVINEFIGSRDFYYFSKRGGGEKTTIRTIHNIAIRRYKRLIIISFEGDGFLRSQIRMIMAAVLKISSGKAEIEDIAKQFAGKSTRFREPAPAEGLYLAKVRY